MKKYNAQLFFIGFMLNIVKKFPLILISVICGILAIWFPPFFYVSVGVLLLVLAWSLFQQLKIKYAVEHSDNPDFAPFANAMMSDNWKDEIMNIIDNKIDDEEDKDDDED